MTAADEEAIEDLPVFWFITLQQALEEGDLEAAADAVRELRRLGITVRVTRPTGRPARQ